jgi:hypothetical protein
MVINENEKNRIKSLYGLMTETAPPPNESVLVAIKNPFKYNEYQTARKFYNPSLKDGEMFFLYKRNELEDYIKSKIKESFDNKTIRYQRLDTPQKVDNIGILRSEFFSQTGNEDATTVSLKLTEPGTQCISFFRMQLRDENGESEEGSIFFEPKVGFVYYEFTTWSPRKTYKVNIQVPSNESIKSKVFSFSNWNTIPDEYFEIRQIKRQNTDF